MTGKRAPRYYTIPSLEDSKGVTYDTLKKVDDWTTEWKEGEQRAYFVPEVEYARNSNPNGADARVVGKAGFGLSAGQWCVILTLLYLNGDPAATIKLLLPLMVLGAGQALLPVVLPETQRGSPTSFDRYAPKGITRTRHNEVMNPDQGPWEINGENWP